MMRSFHYLVEMFRLGRGQCARIRESSPVFHRQHNGSTMIRQVLKLWHAAPCSACDRYTATHAGLCIYCALVTRLNVVPLDLNTPLSANAKIHSGIRWQFEPD